MACPGASITAGWQRQMGKVDVLRWISHASASAEERRVIFLPAARKGRYPMGKVVATEFITLDGVMGEPHEWSFPYWCDEIAKFKDKELRTTEALLLGRVTYDGFAAAWPERKGKGDEFADRFNEMPKYVASATLRDPAWENSHVIAADLAAEIARLKAAATGDLYIHGSATLVQSIVPAGLIDEYHLLVYPIVIGKGKRLFAEDMNAKLELVESTPASSGVVMLTYRPAA